MDVKSTVETHWEISERATWCIGRGTHPTLEKLRERERDPDFLGELSLEELKKGCLNPMKVLGYLLLHRKVPNWRSW